MQPLLVPDRLRGHDRAHGEARRPGRQPSGGAIVAARAAGDHPFHGLRPRQEQTGRRREHIAELNKRAAESELRLKRLYDAIEAGVTDINDPALKDRIEGLKAIRDQARVDAERAQAMLESSGNQAVTP